MLPGFSAWPSGRAVVTARAVSTRIRFASSEREPRTVVAISAPMAVSATEITVSATRTSISVKPAHARRRAARRAAVRVRTGPNHLEAIEGRNLHTSRQPVHADLVAGAEPGQRDDAAARHATGEEADGRPGGALIAARGQHRVEADIVRHADDTARRTRADGAPDRVDLGRHLHAPPERGVAIGLEEAGGLDRIGFKARARGPAREGRQQDGGKDGQDGEDADDFEQDRKSVV